MKSKYQKDMHKINTKEYAKKHRMEK